MDEYDALEPGAGVTLGVSVLVGVIVGVAEGVGVPVLEGVGVPDDVGVGVMLGEAEGTITVLGLPFIII